MKHTIAFPDSFNDLIKSDKTDIVYGEWEDEEFMPFGSMDEIEMIVRFLHTRDKLGNVSINIESLYQTIVWDKNASTYYTLYRELKPGASMFHRLKHEQWKNTYTPENRWYLISIMLLSIKLMCDMSGSELKLKLSLNHEIPFELTSTSFHSSIQPCLVNVE